MARWKMEDGIRRGKVESTLIDIHDKSTFHLHPVAGLTVQAGGETTAPLFFFSLWVYPDVYLPTNNRLD